MYFDLGISIHNLSKISFKLHYFFQQSADLVSLNNWEFWLWKFNNFSSNLILCEINFVRFQNGQKLSFQPFLRLWIMILEKFSHLNLSKCPNNSKFRAAQMVKSVVFGASKWPKLISRKIWVAEKILKFSHSVFPIRLPRSVKFSLFFR